MKTFGLIACNIAIALGIWFGRGDYVREREAERAEYARRQAEAASASRLPTAVAERPAGSRRRPAAAAPGVTDDMLVPVQSAEAIHVAVQAGGKPGRAEAEPTAESFAPSGRLKARFDEVGDALARLDFAAAEKQALAIASDTRESPGIVRDKALQLAAKSRAFQRILARVQSSAAAPAGPKSKAVVAEVQLANGCRFEGRLVEERADRYVFKIGTGGTFSPRREDVLELKKVEKEIVSGPDWNELQPRIAALDDPVDIFVDGVERCFRLGLKREGMQVLERLLARADSDQVPLLFAADADDALLRDWQLAAGRGRSPPPAARSAPESTGAGEPGDDPAPATTAPASVGGADQEALDQAQQLVGEAHGLFRAAVGQEGKGDSLRQAREKLQAARAILAELPEGEPAVKTLRRTIAQLTSDIARVSPF